MSTVKKFRSGTDRVITPSESLDRCKPFLKLIGITRIANVTGLDRVGIPVVMVVRPNSRALTVSQGKGVDIEAATVSGIMESIESYHAERIHIPLRRSSFEDLHFSENTVNIDQLPLIKSSKFSINKRLLWVEAIDLINEENVWVPHELVHTDFTIPFTEDSGCFMLSTNGLASGNHFSEAVSHAICELVERDALAIWAHRDQSYRDSTLVDINSIDDPVCKDILEKFYDAELEVSIWDLTSDIELPCFNCIISEKTDGSKQRYTTSGMGCHPSRRIALFRALSEAAQSRLTCISGSRDDMDRELYRQLHGIKIKKELNKSRNKVSTLKKFKDSPNYESDNIDDDIIYELEALERSGLGQILVVNLTRLEFNIPVARVIIPGLEGLVNSPLYTAGERAIAVFEKNNEQ